MEQKHYPLGDYLSLAERNALGMQEKQALIGLSQAAPSAPGQRALAIDSGEYRPPRKGEWYLSGAVVTAYRAPNDLETPYHIARVVLVKYELTSHVIATL